MAAVPACLDPEGPGIACAAPDRRSCLDPSRRLSLPRSLTSPGGRRCAAEAAERSRRACPGRCRAAVRERRDLAKARREALSRCRPARLWQTDFFDLETSGGGTWRSGDVTGYATKLVLAGPVTATQIWLAPSLPQRGPEANARTRLDGASCYGRPNEGNPTLSPALNGGAMRCTSWQQLRSPPPNCGARSRRVALVRSSGPTCTGAYTIEVQVFKASRPGAGRSRLPAPSAALRDRLTREEGI